MDQFESPRIRSFRELLGLPSNYSPQELKEAYRKLAKLYHPDLNSDDEESRNQFESIKKAYEILSHPSLVRIENSDYLKTQWHKKKVEGLNITFGSFFGYRVFNFSEEFNIKKDQKLIQGKRKKEGFSDDPQESKIDDFSLNYQENNSILDSPAYDAIELVYAGKFSPNDEGAIKAGFHSKVLGQLPWVRLNNQGLIHFMKSEYTQALKCYEELNDRIPLNIIFMYRLALCRILSAYKYPEKTFIGTKQPNKILIRQGIQMLKQCIAIGAERSIGKQKCLAIKKTLADVLAKRGQKFAARKLWKEILHDQNHSVEAIAKLKGKKQAMKKLKELTKKREKIKNPEIRLISSKS